MKQLSTFFWQVLIGTVLVFTGMEGVVSYASAESNSPLQRIETYDRTLRVHWSVSREKLRLSETLTMSITVDHARDWEMLPLEFAETLGDFRVENVERLPLLIRDERQVHRFTLSLSPEKPGTCRIGAVPILIQLPRKSDSGDADDVTKMDYALPFEQRHLVIPAFELEVTRSISDATDLNDVYTPRGPLGIRNDRPYYVLAGIAVALFLAYVLTNRLRVRRTIPVNTVQYTANQLAMRKLASLLDSRLHERDVKLFYTNLTAIVRWYIEQKTEIRAPELTTEEFLREMTLREEQFGEGEIEINETQIPRTAPKNLTELHDAGERFRKAQQEKSGTVAAEPPSNEAPPEAQDEEDSPPKDEHFFFSTKNRTLLAEFLEAADLVKFARFQPSREQIMLGFRRASEFIELGNQFEDSRLLTQEQTELLVTELQITGTHRTAAMKSGVHRPRTGVFQTDSHGTGAQGTGTQGTGTQRSAVFRAEHPGTHESLNPRPEKHLE